MRHTEIAGPGRGRAWLLAFEQGDSVVDALRDFAHEQDVAGAHFHAIGAFRRASLAWYDLGGKRYEEHAVDEQVEVGSLTGNVSRFEGELRIHAHCVLGRRDLSTLAGHLVDAEVAPTLELFLYEGDVPLERSYDERSGLPLL